MTEPAYLSERHYEILRWIEVNPHHSSEIRHLDKPNEERVISGLYGSIIVSKGAWAYVFDFLGPAKDASRLFDVTDEGLEAMRAKEAKIRNRTLTEPETLGP